MRQNEVISQKNQYITSFGGIYCFLHLGYYILLLLLLHTLKKSTIHEQQQAARLL